MKPARKRTYAEVYALHVRAVKAAQRWEAATPGTVTKKKLLAAWQSVEAKFDAALDRVFGID